MFGNMTLGITLKAFDQLSSVVTGATGKAVGAFGKMKDSIASVSTGMQKMGALSVAGGTAIGVAMLKPLNAFADLEDASTQLKNTLMQDGGVVSSYFGEIDAKATQLGNKLPGTTADFYQMASSLKSLGVTEKAIAGGVLDATANLGVVLKPMGVDFAQAAESTAKFKEALGVADKDMVSFADTIQRTAHLGVRLEEMRYAFSKVAPTLQTMGIQGLKAGNELAPLVGMLIKTGKSGEEAGTALGNVVNATLNTKKMKATNDELAKYGVHLDFVDTKSGQFKGILNMVAQLDKLQKLTPVVRANLLTNLFGAGGTADVAAIMATNGIKGYNSMADAMGKQASLTDRVNNSLGTLRNTWEAFGGTAENTMAIFGAAPAEDLKGFVNTLSDVVAGIGDWAKAHPKLTHALGAGAIGLSGFLVTGGTVLGTVGLVGHGVAGAASGVSKLGEASSKLGPKLAGGFAKAKDFGNAMLSWRFPSGMFQRAQMAFTGFQVRAALSLALVKQWTLAQFAAFRASFFTAAGINANITALKGYVAAQLTAVRTNFLSVGGLKAMGATLLQSVVTGFKGATRAAWGFNASLLANPLTWIALGIGGAALLIWKYWKPISGFFRGLWAGIKEGAAPLMTALAPTFKKLQVVLAPIIAPLKAVWTWVKNLLKPVDDVGGGAEKMGKRWGKAIAGIVGGVIGFYSTIYKTIWKAGQTIVTMFVDGIKSLANKPAEIMKGIVQKVRNLLPFSPAKEGPLRDIHRIKLVETIAGSVKPGPLVSAMTRVASAARDAALPPPGRLTPGLSASPRAAGGGGAISLTYAPTITVAGASSQDKDDFAALLLKHRHQIEQMLRDVTANQQRTSFS